MSEFPRQTRHRTAMICVHKDALLVCWFRDPHSGGEFYVVPGGKIESKESARECAERETWEETGYRVRVCGEAVTTTRYPFEWAGQIYDCVTTWFIGTLTEPDTEPTPVDDAEFNLRTAWLPLEEIPSAFACHAHIGEMVTKLVERALKGADE